METSFHPKRQILVVDDEPAVSEVMKLMLQFDGHQVKTAACGSAALALLKESKFDLVITDYSMPEMKGDELAVAIKQRWPDQHIIMLSAHALALKDSGRKLAGIDALIGKPFLFEDLRSAIAQSFTN
jgi:CheY-like chemotaxis protein